MNKSGKNRRLGVESLESRQLMAADIGLNHGVLSIVGTDGSDVVEVRTVADEIRVTIGTDATLVSKSFSRTAVNRLAIKTLGGDDVVRNQSSLPASIAGGGGHDLLIGGSGADTISGGGGNDAIHGGQGSDLLKGGSGNDRLYGEQGNDKIRGGAGQDLLVGGEGRDAQIGGSGDDEIIDGLRQLGSDELQANPHDEGNELSGPLAEAVDAAILSWDQANNNWGDWIGVRPAIVMPGLSADQMAAVKNAAVVVADLPGDKLGMVTRGGEGALTVWIDDDAAGQSWQLNDVSKFGRLKPVIPIVPPGQIWLDGLPEQGIDLISVLAHEFGHVLGARDAEDGSIMDDSNFQPGNHVRPTPKDFANLPTPEAVTHLAIENGLFDFAFNGPGFPRYNGGSSASWVQSSLSNQYTQSLYRNPYTSYYSRSTGRLGRGWWF